jgi:hypothetical protein
MADIRDYNGVFKGRTGVFEDISSDPSVDGSDDIPSFVAVVTRKRGPNKKKVPSTVSDAEDTSSKDSPSETVEFIPADVPPESTVSPMFRRR